MTFTEAAIEVLRREGKPLHFKKIAEIAVRESLLDHVGKIPEEVMGGQLATHCKLPPADRKVVAVQPGTFALVEWGLDEDPAGLENIIETPPEDEVPYRARERHPTPSRDMARAAGRGEGRARRREEGEERRGRRFPPPAEVAYEILAGADRPLALSEIAAQGAERFLMPDAFVRDHAALAAALAEDNRRREAGGRKALFAIDGETVSLAAQPEPGERAAVPLAAARPAVSAAELRKSALLALRRRLRECDPPTTEHVVARLLEAMGLRELKVAKRGRDQVVYTGRRRMGLADVRHCVRILRSGAEPTRRDVNDVRRDVGNYGAQVGVLVSTGDAGREARAEASAAGQLPVLLFAGDALAEAFTEHGVGCKPVVIPDLDEAFFRTAAETAQQEEAARRARREERERRESREERGREPAPPEPVAAAQAEAAAPVAAAEPGVLAAAAEELDLGAAAQVEAGGEDGEDADEGDGDAEGGGPAEEDGQAKPGAAAATGEGEGRRRRRRRRRRGGRGRGREGAAATGGADAAGAQGAPAPPGPAGEQGAPAAGAGGTASAPNAAPSPPEPPPPEGPPPTAGE